MKQERMQRTRKALCQSSQTACHAGHTWELLETMAGFLGGPPESGSTSSANNEPMFLRIIHLSSEIRFTHSEGLRPSGLG